MSAGAMLAVAFGLTGQVTAPMGALVVGIATPIIVEKLSKKLPIIEGEPWVSDVASKSPDGGSPDRGKRRTPHATNADEEEA